MSLPARHLVHQGPVLASLGGTVVSAVLQRLRGGAGARRGAPGAGARAEPGPELSRTLPPRPAELVRDYVRHVGGDPSAYRGVLPPHLFPQWGFPLAARTLRGVPYPLAKVLNAGCRLEVRAPLPADEPLEVTARLERIDDDGRRALLHQRVVTGTRSSPEAVIGHMIVLVPLAPKDRDGDARRPRKEPARVPGDATELAYWRLPPDAGLAFALLTGDFNPVHWIPPYARAMGFRSTILHGFATMARAIEGLNRRLFAGAVDRIASIDVQFTRPLVLPARVGLYLDGASGVTVGDAPGGPAYLAGSFERRDRGNP